ncbi:MAG TPA: PilN domain-containing protein [Candidatus Acidoferrales bacterium]|nr:PilN domain-containing protein [Candidatus Acidoferrales bacterium]
MRTNINLASQKYEDVRMFVSRAGVATLAMVVFTVLLSVLAWFNYSSSRKSSAHIRELDQKINDLQQQRAKAVQVENQPENRVVMDENKYWNRQINRRGFSWTQLFNDLQKIMPGRVYVISVAPELTPDNQLKLKMTIGGESSQDLNDLVKKMEGSQKFRHTELKAQTIQKESKPGMPPLNKFDIETFYMPVATTAGRKASGEGL